MQEAGETLISEQKVCERDVLQKENESRKVLYLLGIVGTSGALEDSGKVPWSCACLALTVQENAGWSTAE